MDGNIVGRNDGNDENVLYILDAIEGKELLVFDIPLY